MKYLIVFLLSLAQAQAAFPELFGPSAASIAVGSQAVKNSASNNYTAPALLGYSDKTQFSFDVFYVDTDFKSIDNVVIKNESTTVNTFERGNIEVNATPTSMMALHFSTPLFTPEGPKFNFSLIAPFDRLMEADTGDPYRPRYVMYANRFIRPMLILSGAQNFGEWSFSAGAQTGFQSNGETYIVTRDQSEDEPSMGKLNFNAKPSIAAIASVSKKTGDDVTFLTFQQEMKSRLINRATGETDIGGNGSFQFDLDIASLIYYDPMTLRLGHQFHFSQSSMYLTIEYQQWENYEASTLKIKKRGGTMAGSDNFEKLKLKDIFIPRIGYEQKLYEQWSVKIGYFYRESPLDTRNLKNAGNSIDMDKHVASAGGAYHFKLYQKEVTFDFAYQLHLLRSLKIKKTPGLEGNQVPDSPAPEENVKIGSPGYEVGGRIHVLTAGLSWMY
jgi:long-subunit fatty acid transport protein